MTEPRPTCRYRFGVFEADAATGELRRQGLRVKLHAQPLQLLFLLLERPGELLTREEISYKLWPNGTFVDYEHGVNSAVNRIREALGDKASSPRFIETLARRGYRFVAPVERIVAERRWPAALTAWLASQRSSRETGGRFGKLSRSRALRPGGFAEEPALCGEDVVPAAAGDVPGLLCRRAGEPGGDTRADSAFAAFVPRY